MRGGDALVYCGQPDGQRQLLRLAQLPDKVDGVAQVCACCAPTDPMLHMLCQLRLRMCLTFYKVSCNPDVEGHLSSICQTHPLKGLLAWGTIACLGWCYVP